MRFPPPSGGLFMMETAMDLLAFLLARAKEPSSYAGLAMVLSAAGIHFSDLQFNAIVNLLIALAGAVAIFVPEEGATLCARSRRSRCSAGLWDWCRPATARRRAARPPAVLPLSRFRPSPCKWRAMSQAAPKRCSRRSRPPCAAYAPVAASLAPIASGNKTVGNILLYGNSVCDPATGTVQPGVALDTGTAAWTGAITGILKGFAAFAAPTAAAPAAPANGS